MPTQDFLYDHITLVSEDKKVRWKLFVRLDGRLSVVQLFDDGKGDWKPAAGEKVAAWTDYQAKVTH